MTDNRNFHGSTEIVVFGRRVVTEALETAGVTVLGVRLDDADRSPYGKTLRTACNAAGVPFERVKRRAVEEWSRAGRHDQGVAARVALSNVVDVEEWGGSIVGKRAALPARLLALDGITNPQNVGMIVRSVLASGLDGVLWPMAGVPWLDGLVIKASAATALRCPLVSCQDIDAGLDALQSRGFRVFGLDAAGPGESASVFDHDPPHRACYVVGSETEGLSEAARGRLDGVVSIPMAGGVESLNAAVAASIVAFALGRGGG